MFVRVDLLSTTFPPLSTLVFVPSPASVAPDDAALATPRIAIA
jgi:hypothetical protein